MACWKCCLVFQMHLDSPEALGVLNTLFETVAPSSLRPVDMLLKSMFVTPSTMVSPPPQLVSLLGLLGPEGGEAVGMSS